MSQTNSPTVICQTIIKESVEKVFRLLISPEGVRLLWFAESPMPLDQNKTVRWQWDATEISLEIQVKKIIPNTLLSVLWMDSCVTVDILCEKITDQNTLVTFKAYNFQEEEFELLHHMESQQSMCMLALKNLKDFYAFHASLEHQQDSRPINIQPTS